MYFLRVVIFSLDEPNLTRITVFKENLVKYKVKRTSRECTFILFLIHCYIIQLFSVTFIFQKYKTIQQLNHETIKPNEESIHEYV